jgi:hypothetical protein
MQSADLIRAYTGAGPGLVFRMRLKSSNQALGHRIQHGPRPSVATPVQPFRPGRNGS